MPGSCDCFEGQCPCCRLIPGPQPPSDEDLKRLEQEREREVKSLLDQISAAVIVPGEMFERFLYGTEPLSSANDESYGMGC